MVPLSVRQVNLAATTVTPNDACNWLAKYSAAELRKKQERDPELSDYKLVREWGPG